MSRQPTTKPNHHQHNGALTKSASTRMPAPSSQPPKASQKYQQKAAATAQQKKKYVDGQCTCDFKIGNKVKSVTYDVTYTEKNEKYFTRTNAILNPSQAQREAICANACKEAQAETDAKIDAKQKTTQFLETAVTTAIVFTTAVCLAHRLFQARKQTPENPAQQKSHRMKR